MHVAQTIRPLIIKPVNPVSKGLTVHSAYTGGICSVHAIQNGGQRQEASTLIVVLGLAGEATQILVTPVPA